MDRDLPGRADRPLPLIATFAGVGLAVVGVVVGALLAVHTRLSCGNNVYDLIQTYCTHKTHPHLVLGLVVLSVSAAVGIGTGVLVSVQRKRRTLQ